MVKIEKAENSFRFKEGIISIFEDSKGNFWFGTKDEGICKSDELYLIALPVCPYF